MALHDIDTCADCMRERERLARQYLAANPLMGRAVADILATLTVQLAEVRQNREGDIARAASDAEAASDRAYQRGRAEGILELLRQQEDARQDSRESMFDKGMEILKEAIAQLGKTV